MAHEADAAGHPSQDIGKRILGYSWPRQGDMVEPWTELPKPIAKPALLPCVQDAYADRLEIGSVAAAKGAVMRP